MTAPDRSYLRERPEPILRDALAAEARDAAAAFDRRRPDGLYDVHPLNCGCRQCLLDEYEPGDGA